MDDLVGVEADLVEEGPHVTHVKGQRELRHLMSYVKNSAVLVESEPQIVAYFVEHAWRHVAFGLTRVHFGELAQLHHGHSCGETLVDAELLKAHCLVQLLHVLLELVPVALRALLLILFAVGTDNRRSIVACVRYTCIGWLHTMYSVSVFDLTLPIDSVMG